MSATDRAKEAWWMATERKERQLSDRAQIKRTQQREKAAGLRVTNASEWIRRHTPEFVDDRGVDSMAVYAAMTIKDMTGRAPTAVEVRRYYALWTEQGSRVAKGWLIAAADLRVSDHRQYIRWEGSTE